MDARSLTQGFACLRAFLSLCVCLWICVCSELCLCRWHQLCLHNRLVRHCVAQMQGYHLHSACLCIIVLLLLAFALILILATTSKRNERRAQSTECLEVHCAGCAGPWARPRGRGRSLGGVKRDRYSSRHYDADGLCLFLCMPE